MAEQPLKGTPVQDEYVETNLSVSLTGVGAALPRALIFVTSLVVISGNTRQWDQGFLRSLNFAPRVLSILSSAYKFASDATLCLERWMVTRVGTNVTYPGIFAT